MIFNNDIHSYNIEDIIRNDIVVTDVERFADAGNGNVDTNWNKDIEAYEPI